MALLTSPILLPPPFATAADAKAQLYPALPHAAFDTTASKFIKWQPAGFRRELPPKLGPFAHGLPSASSAAISIV